MRVIDSSVVAKLILEEEDSSKVRDLFQEEPKFYAPDILLVELANTIATKANYPSNKISEALDFIYLLDLDIRSIDKVLLVESAELARDYKTAVYDMVYAVLAKKLKTTLLTADKRFVERVKMDWVEYFS